MKTTLTILGWAMMLAALVLTATSCQVTIHPDGSRTYGADAEQAARIITILENK